MSGGHRLSHDMLSANWRVPDPGTGHSVDLSNRGRTVCGFVSATAETRTIPAPVKVGQQFMAYLDTDGGDITVTVTSGQGVTTIVMDDAGDAFWLEAIEVGTTVKWRVMASKGIISQDAATFSALVTMTGGLAVDADELTVGGVIVSPTKLVSVNCVANGACVDQQFFIADRAYQVTAINEIHAVAGNDAGAVSLQVTKDTSTNAPGAGTDLLTNTAGAGFNMKSTAQTVVAGTLSVTASDLQLAAGDRLSLDFAGTITTLAGVTVTVTLKAI
jgi:hypothetical protein